MSEYSIIKLPVNILNERLEKGKTNEIASIADLAKLQLLNQLRAQQEQFNEYIDNKSAELQHSLQYEYLDNWMRVKDKKNVLESCEYKEEISILNNDEKLSLLKEFLNKSISKITFLDDDIRYSYIDVFFDWIDEDWEDDDVNDSPVLYLLPNFVINDWWSVEVYENHPLEVYLDDICEVILDAKKYTFLSL